jgi:hypothetical protein
MPGLISNVSLSITLCRDNIPLARQPHFRCVSLSLKLISSFFEVESTIVLSSLWKNEEEGRGREGGRLSGHFFI